MGTPPSFSAMFSKGDNLCDFLENEVFPKWGLLLKKRLYSNGPHSFLHEMTPILGGNNENNRAASPESVPI